MSKSVFFKALPEEVNRYINDFVCRTQEQWRYVFNGLLIEIEYSGFCQHYCRKLGRNRIFHTLLCDKECFERVEFQIEDYPTDDEDYDLLI
jgi:hypothetical protein